MLFDELAVDLKERRRVLRFVICDVSETTHNVRDKEEGDDGEKEGLGKVFALEIEEVHDSRRAVCEKEFEKIDHQGTERFWSLAYETCAQMKWCVSVTIPHLQQRLDVTCCPREDHVDDR